MKRRTYLRGSLVGMTLGFAGCSGDDGGNGTDGGDSDGTDDGSGNGDGTMEETPTETTTTEEATPTETETTTTEEATPTETETTTEDPAQTTTQEPTPTTTQEPTPEPPDQEVEVGAGGLNFSPESFTVSTGETVRWVWRSSNHNVVPNDVPEGTDWEGSPGGAGDLYNEGFSFEHTFTTPGEYSYYCNPHRSAGMTGSFTVEE